MRKSEKYDSCPFCKISDSFKNLRNENISIRSKPDSKCRKAYPHERISLLFGIHYNLLQRQRESNYTEYRVSNAKQKPYFIF